MSYSDDQTFTLEQVGAPDLWVTYSRPGLLPYKEGQAFMRKHKLFNTKVMALGETATMADALSKGEAEFEWILQLITGWNLVYHSKHEKSGEPLPIPSAEEGIWMEIPGYYMTYIVATIQKDPTGSDFLSQGVASLTNTLSQSSTEENQIQEDSVG